MKSKVGTAVGYPLSPSVVVVAALILAAACTTERDRPTGPSAPTTPGFPLTPLVLIDKPAADTVVAEGDQVLIEGTVAAAAGLDSLFVEVIGSSFSFPPQGVSGQEIGFQFPLATTGLAGVRLEIRVSALDMVGNLGGPVIRVLSVQ